MAYKLTGVFNFDKIYPKGFDIRVEREQVSVDNEDDPPVGSRYFVSADSSDLMLLNLRSNLIVNMTKDINNKWIQIV